jgi:hypothetical protein
MSGLRWHGLAFGPLWAWLADAVDDDAGQAEHHPDEDDDMTEPGAGRVADAVGDDVEQQAEDDDGEPEPRGWLAGHFRPL